jgi:flagellar motor switch protein FliN/FliY
LAGKGGDKEQAGGLAPIREELLRELHVTLEVRLGSASMPMAEILSLEPGSVVTLDRSLADHVDLYLNGTLVARGEIVAVGDRFGVRVVELGPAG